MRRRLTLLLAGLLFAGGVPASRAQADASPFAAMTAPEATWTLTPTLVSQYMFRGARLGGPSFEPMIERSAGDLTLGLWGNFPLVDKVPGQSDPELDIYGAYAIALNRATSLVPGFTWYNFPRAENAAGFYRTTFEPSVALNWTVKGVRLTPKLYYDLVLHGPTYELTAATALPLKAAGTQLDFTATLGTFGLADALADASPATKSWGNYWLLGVSAPFQWSARSKVTVGFAYTRGSGSYFKQGSQPEFANASAVGRGVVTLSYAFTF